MVQKCKEFAFLCRILGIWCPKNFYVGYVEYPISGLGGVVVKALLVGRSRD
jgi:hypothetical protein